MQICTHRLDIEAAKNKVTDRELNLLTAQNEATLESEKQKAQMLLYVDYVKEVCCCSDPYNSYFYM